MSLVVVDLGLGNLHSVVTALRRVGAEPVLSSDPARVAEASRLVVPGQGAFRDGSHALFERDGGEIARALRERIAADVPYLGICLGMQLLFEGSEEAPGAPGLGVFPGMVKRFAADLLGPEGEHLKVPHIGWNRVHRRDAGHEHDAGRALLEDDAWYYFVHSYYCPSGEHEIASANYGHGFCAAAARDRLFACQFHPEKSHRRGETLLRRFAG